MKNSFYSKTFFVRYAEELVVLRDIIKFRSEVDVEAGYLETEFFLKTEFVNLQRFNAKLKTLQLLTSLRATIRNEAGFIAH